ncbi:drug/metabolite transporter (DMT)-like permease [Planktotalea frisia]|jgi:drug/metabolite transporter (DMT)-like permease|uniref:EamA-like transporter family protein n=1 Tax=Planktotalea frisia TaxID=696762 RepID=A0A1L9NY62_9RHOB|nr:DMT family transporter [Planktotalea frisia]OJI94132.1 EamA-like transporter family protein [Planktotalea frisia]PZX29605.1 drug/metabolite transporter (DMT)-like permease [Planktotalea frisia]
MGSNTKGALIVLLAFAIFSTHDIIVKFLGASYSPIQIVFFSVLFGFPWMTLMLIRDTSSGNLLPRHPWWTALRTIATTLTGISAFYAFSKLPLAQVYAILFAAPLLITILSIPILGEQVRLRRWVAVLIGLCGVLVVLRPGAEPLTLGHLAALVAAVGGALASIIVRKIGKDERSVVLLIYPMMTNFMIMGAALPFVYQPMPMEHLGGIVVMSIMALIGSALVIAAYKAGEAVIVAPMQYSQIIWASVFGALLFGETMDFATLLGAVIIIGSGVYIVLREGRGNSSENTPVLRTRTRTETGTSLRIGPLIRARRKRETKE